MKIILDTNFLMAVSQFKVDIFDELMGHELYTLDLVIGELEAKSVGNSLDAKSAKIGLDLVKKKALKILNSKEKKADDSLVEYSKENYTIATQDRELQQRIKDVRGKVIFIRQKKYVLIE